MTQPNTPLPNFYLRKASFYRAAILLATLGPAMAFWASAANLETRALNLQATPSANAASAPAAPAPAPAASAPAPARPADPTLPKPFAEVIKDAKQQDGLFPIWRKDEKVWLEIPKSALDKPFLFTVNIASSVGERGLYASQMGSDALA